MASLLSFKDLFAELKKFIPDQIERWQECVKVKRGLQDTSKLSGMYKDQIYLKGAIEILINRKHIDFMGLYGGKISLKDYSKLESRNLINKHKICLPYFLQDSDAVEEYL